MKSIDLQALREARPIPGFLDERGHPLHRTPDGWRGRCPIHQGDNPTAFHVSADGTRWHCFRGCGGGDVIDLVMGLDACSFGDACSKLGARTAATGFRAARERQRMIPPALNLPPLTTEKRDLMARFCDRLAREGSLQEQLAESRHWETPTISSLACPTSTSLHGALGWVDHAADGDGGLCFVYPNAVKVRPLYRDSKVPGGWRWHRQDGSKSPYWLWKGWPWNGIELWREDRLVTSPVSRTSCILTEGEPDAISVIDDDMENTVRAVLALPSASIGASFRGRLRQFLTGLDVAFMPDLDAAGQQAVQVVQMSLRGFSRELRIIAPPRVS